MFCPSRLNLKTHVGNACCHHGLADSHASKIRLFLQFVLVRKIFEDFQEMVWPECKQCSR